MDLLSACESGDLRNVKTLLTKIESDKSKALYIACSRGHIDIVKYLIEECRVEPWQHELFGACKEGRTEVVKYLVEECHARIGAEDNRALKLASKENHTDVIILLIENGAHMYVNDYEPLKWAKYYRNQELIDYLIESGADKRVLKMIIMLKVDNYGQL